MEPPADIAASLTMDEIPVKLRCAICNKLANNAFRTPCCEQSICETCQSTLPQACPVCLHEPVKADDCKPNKALRTTIRVFLRKKGMEREALRKKAKVDDQQATPTTSSVQETPVPLPSRGLTESSKGSIEPNVAMKQTTCDVSHTSQGPPSATGSDILGDGQPPSMEAQMDIPRPSIESANEDMLDRPQGLVGETGSEQDKVVQDGSVLEQQQRNGQNPGSNDQWTSNIGSSHGMAGNGFMFDGTNFGFPNMGFNGASDFSQMMQFMPNGMPNPSMGAFPNMMGMPGMGMDPMALSQSMYGGFGGQGVGMNGMNMGMGFTAGQGAFGGFNGQPGSWNAGQDKFNPNAYGGHANGMGGDFGTNGYAGYNMPPHQGNFNQMHHQQFPNNDVQNGYNGQAFHNRGRGRGRGYHNANRGRGGFNQVMPGNQANYEPFHHQIPPQLVHQSPSQQSAKQEQQTGQEQSSSGEAQQVTDAAVTSAGQAADEQMNEELNPGGEGETQEITNLPSHSEENVEVTSDPVEAATKSEAPVEATSASENIEEAKPAPIQTFISTDPPEPDTGRPDNAASVQSAMMPPPNPVIPLGPAALYSVDQSYDYNARGRGSGRGSYRGGLRGRGSGYLSNGAVVHSSSMQLTPATDPPIIAPTEPKGLGVEGAPKGPKALREGLLNHGMRGGTGLSIVGRASMALHARSNGPTRSRSPSAPRHRSTSRSRSPSRHHRHSRHHRTHRHRSASSSEDSERQRRRERHRRRSRKYDDEEIADGHQTKEPQKRDTSVESSSRRSSHRSYREPDHDYDKDAGRGSHRSHRSQRDRSKEREEERRRGSKRSRSRDDETDIAKVIVDEELAELTNSRYSEKNEDSTRKRRDRDDEDRYRERKRSKRGHSEGLEEKENEGGSSRRNKRDGTETPRSNHVNGERSQEKLVDQPKSASAGKKPETDHHTLEREARNRERLQKELQRREAMEGKGPVGKRRDSKTEVRGSGSGRRVSYKYEDEESDEARAMRVESEREAGRWR